MRQEALKQDAFLSRLAVASLGWLALFALCVAVAEAVGLRPEPPEGGFHGSDLAAGLVFGAALLASLVFRRAD